MTNYPPPVAPPNTAAAEEQRQPLHIDNRPLYPQNSTPGIAPGPYAPPTQAHATGPVPAELPAASERNEEHLTFSTPNAEEQPIPHFWPQPTGSPPVVTMEQVSSPSGIPADDHFSQDQAPVGPTMREPTLAKKVVLVGNPGVGKSCILNTLLGAGHFRAGTSLGSGLTLKTSGYTADDGVQYIDTPGLDDVETRHHAAAEISKALSGPAEIRLVFVTTLEAGRVRSADLTTLDVVLSAVEAAGVDTQESFSLVINKCEPDLLASLRNADVWKQALAPFEFVKLVRHVVSFPIDETALGARNVVLSNRDHLVRFVTEAPCFQLQAGQVVNVDVKAYDEKKEAMAREAMELRTAIDALMQQHAAIQEGGKENEDQIGIQYLGQENGCAGGIPDGQSGAFSGNHSSTQHNHLMEDCVDKILDEIGSHVIAFAKVWIDIAHAAGNSFLFQGGRTGPF